jgi:hypothetical protein
MDIIKESGQVEIISPYGRVYLYTEKTANHLVADVYNALAEHKNWDDADLLAKMVFCRMTPMECWQTDSGFGIGTQLYADTNLLITLDTVHQMIKIQSATDKQHAYQDSFAAFVKSYMSSAEI